MTGEKIVLACFPGATMHPYAIYRHAIRRSQCRSLSARVVLLTAVLLPLFLIASVRQGGAQMSWGKAVLITVPRRPARVISFPNNYALGLFRMSPCPGVRGDEKAVAARGKVTVPAGYISLFLAEHQFFAHLELVDGFPPDAIDSIQLTAVALDENEEGQVDKALSKIVHLKGLREVILDRSDVTDYGIAFLAELPQLQRLSMFSTSFNGSSLQRLQSLSHLEKLRISQNTIKQENLKYLPSMKALNFLSMSRCNLKPAALVHVAKCSNLTALDISGNPELDDAALKNLVSLKKLSFLSVAKTKITAAGVLQLKGLPLRMLMPSDRQFSNAEIKALYKTFPGLIVSQKTYVKAVDDDTRTLYAPHH